MLHESSLTPTQQLQQQFAAHIRDPQERALPNGVTPERMRIYQELFYNNIEGFISTGFPVLRSLYRDAAWRELVQQFIQHHHSTTPYFSKIPVEFINFLQQEYTPQPEDPLFLLELAHYEWIELELSISTNEPEWDLYSHQLDPLQGVPVLSPLVRALQYPFPVHTISAEQIPDAPSPQPTFLLVYRDRQAVVHFLEATPFVARLLALISEPIPYRGEEMITLLAEESGLPLTDTLLQQGTQMINNLLTRGILLGYTKEP
ncbi:MAG: DUF2063 domain-containing protein [Gammaproteobacteria bacterium]|nr:DUF2063 domain-containing protein [Gammaproteobacteria bacterium]